MNTRTGGLTRFTAAACATAITTVGAWAFVNSTAAIERDPFHFASIMAENARVRVAQAAGPRAAHPADEVGDYALPGILAPLPVCLKGCA
jgi:hypothetical protein